MADTDNAWESIAKVDPYWGVLSSAEYLGSQLSGEAERAFFQSGEAHVARVLEMIRTHVQADFAPGTALDYGCGVGRVLIPLAQACDRAVGVDISATMLARAAEHVRRAGLTNVELRRADDLASVPTPVDFVHCALVLQHIAPARGMAILERLLAALAPGGCGAIQFHFRGSGGQSVRTLRRWRERSQVVNALAVRAMRRPARDSLILVHEYDATSVLRAFSANGVPDAHVETSARTDGHTDATLYFRKAA